MGEKLKMEELKRLSVKEFKEAKKTPIVVVLDNIRSLSNVGSVFRTCDAFLISKLYLCGITAKPPHREIHKTAIGATESVNWVYKHSTMDAILELKELGYKVISVEQTKNSTKLNEFYPSLNSKYALVFGNEVKGVDDNIIKISDECLEIPQWGTKHSLNVSVSVGITIWDIALKIR